MAPSPASHGFPPAARLRAAGDFVRVQKSGRSHDLGSVVIRVAPGAAATGGRLGLAISRKVGNAVVRNRVKRLFRETFRKQQSDFAGRDLVVIGRPAAASLTQIDVERLFRELLRRVGG